MEVSDDAISEEGEEEIEEVIDEKPAVWKPSFKRNLDASQSAILDAQKQIRSILNKVSEGNIDPMFNELSTLLENGFKENTRLAYSVAYSDIFISLVASQQQ